MFDMKDRDLMICNEPNKYARPASLELLPRAAVFHGYQEFTLMQHTIRPSSADVPLQQKHRILKKLFTPRYLKQRTMLDLGGNAGFFSFWALQQGAERATCVDMDEAYVRIVQTTRDHLGISNLEVVNENAVAWQEPGDVVLALALVHWMFSCTALYGSLSEVIKKLASLTRYMLVVEWVSPADPAIEFFHHTDWNAACIRAPYTQSELEAALATSFPRFEMIGDVSPTRTLYVAFAQRHEVDLSGPLPLLFDKDTVVSSRLLTTENGVDYWSRVYIDTYRDLIIKQATLDLAEREASLLAQLDDEHFPKARDVQIGDGFSVVTLEKINGTPLADALPEISSNCERMHAFFSHCLDTLEQLELNGIQHRDIQPGNILIRDGKPVLIDFGWAVSKHRPYVTPLVLGSETRPKDKVCCDVYSMGQVFAMINRGRYGWLSTVIELMTEEDAALRVANLAMLRLLFSIAALKETSLNGEEGAAVDGNPANTDSPCSSTAPNDSTEQVVPALLELVSEKNKRLALLTSRRRELEAQLLEKDKVNEELALALNERDREVERQQAEIERQRSEVERQQAEIERQRSEVECQQAEIERQRSEIERQRIIARDLGDQNTGLAEAVRWLQEEVAVRNRTIQGIYAGRLWRIATPLFSLHHLLQRTSSTGEVLARRSLAPQPSSGHMMSGADEADLSSPLPPSETESYGPSHTNVGRPDCDDVPCFSKADVADDNQPANSLLDLGELYHDYSIFGYKNRQASGIFAPNQRCKAPIINAYIQMAIAKCKRTMNDQVSFAELFCADGYYAMVARHLGATVSYGIDNNRDGFFTKARLIAQRLGVTNVEFIEEDVNNIERLERVDIVANIGGLYHVSNPREIIIKSYSMAKKYLILQSVVSMANDSPDYFEAPAPGWTWGCRLGRRSFDNMIHSLGYEILDQHFNELEGNDRLEDRGSVYYLIKAE